MHPSQKPDHFVGERSEAVPVPGPLSASLAARNPAEKNCDCDKRPDQ